MIRAHLNRALLIAAGLLLASGAAPDARAAGHDASVTAKAAKPKAAAPLAGKTARRDTEHERMRATVHGAMDDARQQEQRRHAERLARIDRVKSLAAELADKDVGERANKLREKEQVRHEKWMSNFNATKQANAKGDSKKK